MFDFKKCKIPTVYCGKEKTIPKSKSIDDRYYIRKGTPYECMTKGIGMGIITVSLKGIPANSVRHIKYVGEVYSKNLSKNNVKNIGDLIKYSKKNSNVSLEKLLKKSFTKKDGKLDKRAYNSTLMYLAKNGVDHKKLPVCSKITL